MFEFAEGHDFVHELTKLNELRLMKTSQQLQKIIII